MSDLATRAAFPDAVTPGGAEGGLPGTPAQPRMLVFRRGALMFACPVETVIEVTHAATVETATGKPGVAGFVAYRETYLTAVDPAAAIGAADPASAPSIVVVETGTGWIAILCDDVAGLKSVDRVVGAQWLDAEGPVRASAMIEDVGHAYVLTPAALAAYPTARPTKDVVVAPPEQGEMFLTFRIGDEQYAAAFPDIERILHDCQAWPLPGGAFPLRRVVEANGAVVPVLDMEEPDDTPDVEERSLFVVLRTAAGPLAVGVDSVGRPERLVPEAGDTGWFAGRGVAGLAQGKSIAFRVVTGPALLAPIAPGAEP